MQIIVKGKDPGYSLWCNPAIEQGNYRLMRYHVKTECNGNTILLNTVTGEAVSLSKQEIDLVNSLPSPYITEMNDLVAHRFLVPESFDELASVYQLRKIIRSYTFCKDQINAFTILPTTACNARCFYCYESEYPRHTMNEEMARLVVEYIEANCGDSQKASLSWFGGEPTLGEKYIDYICDHLENDNIQFHSSMVSNGFLFTKEMAHKAKNKWRLNNIQITLDGTEEVYNEVKSYINPGENPFQRVLNNIKYLLGEGIYVSIRMNLDRHNSDNLIKLIDLLAERFLQYKNFSVYVHEIFEGMGYSPISRSEDELQNVIKMKYSIESYIDSKGLMSSSPLFKKELPSIKTAFCMADNPTSVMVNPEGKLGKCQHTQFSHLYGDLKRKSLIDKKELFYWLEYRVRKECYTCPLYPACGVPQACESGRACEPIEVEHKLALIKKLLLNIITKADESNKII